MMMNLIEPFETLKILIYLYPIPDAAAGDPKISRHHQNQDNWFDIHGGKRPKSKSPSETEGSDHYSLGALIVAGRLCIGTEKGAAVYQRTVVQSFRVEDGNKSRPNNSWCDWCSQATLRHMGQYGQCGVTHGEHRKSRRRSGTALLRSVKYASIYSVLVYKKSGSFGIGNGRDMWYSASVRLHI